MSTIKYSSAEYAINFKTRNNEVVRHFHLHCIPQVIRRISGVISRRQLTPEMVKDVIQFTYNDVFRKLDENRYVEMGKFLEFFTSFAYKRAEGGDPCKPSKKLEMSSVGFQKTVQEAPNTDFPLTANKEKATTDAFERLDIRKVLGKEIDKLNNNYRRIMILHYEEGLTYEEIGDYLGKSESNVKVCMHRSRQQILKWGKRISKTD